MPAPSNNQVKRGSGGLDWWRNLAAVFGKDWKSTTRIVLVSTALICLGLVLVGLVVPSRPWHGFISDNPGNLVALVVLQSLLMLVEGRVARRSMADRARARRERDRRTIHAHEGERRSRGLDHCAGKRQLAFRARQRSSTTTTAHRTASTNQPASRAPVTLQ